MCRCARTRGTRERFSYSERPEISSAPSSLPNAPAFHAGIARAASRTQSAVHWLTCRNFRTPRPIFASLLVHPGGSAAGFADRYFTRSVEFVRKSSERSDDSVAVMIDETEHIVRNPDLAGSVCDFGDLVCCLIVLLGSAYRVTPPRYILRVWTRGPGR